MDTRVGCYAIVLDDERRLLLAHWNEGDLTAWTLPGGPDRLPRARGRRFAAPRG
jgi:8-oxo-dGTP diphosphatase